MKVNFHGHTVSEYGQISSAQEYRVIVNDTFVFDSPTLADASAYAMTRMGEDYDEQIRLVGYNRTPEGRRWVGERMLQTGDYEDAWYHA